MNVEPSDSCTASTLAATDLRLPGQVSGAVHVQAAVIEHEQMARSTWRMRLRCPQIARQIRPGQFFMIRMPRRSDPLLGRPFALYDVYDDASGQPEGVDFGYMVVGKMTALLETLRPGDDVEVWGPLGNGFPVPPTEGHLVIVAGGIGQTPFLAVIREALQKRTYGHPIRNICRSPDRITLCYGVRSVEYLAGVDEFRREQIDVRIATDDGSAGHHGFVTDLLQSLVAEHRGFAKRSSPGHPTNEPAPFVVYCCGPEPMMHAVSKLTAAAEVPCWLSLETPMACGFGACFSCVAKIRQDDDSWDYRRVCVEGPVFAASQIIF